MIGQKTGLNTDAHSVFSYIEDSDFPGNHVLQRHAAEATGYIVKTPASSLLESIGQSDFMFLYWFSMSDPVHAYLDAVIGEIGTNGTEIYQLTTSGTNANLLSDVPGADNSYPTATTPDFPVTPSRVCMAATVYTTADNTLRLYLNAELVASVVNTAGIGAPDPANYMYYSLGNTDIGFASDNRFGFTALWQGSTGVANAVSKMADLYNDRLQYSEFD